jgi:hypothetical protein
MFLEDVELLEASIDIVAYIIPGVGSIMLLKIGVATREVPESLSTAERSINWGMVTDPVPSDWRFANA